jgi:hypothetical protein
MEILIRVARGTALLFAVPALLLAETALGQPPTATPTPTATATPDKPNFIFIMTDDHGWPFYNFMSNLTVDKDDLLIEDGDYPGTPPADPWYIGQHEQFPILPFPTPSSAPSGAPTPPGALLTPNIDDLAGRGVMFPLGYTSASVCKPSLKAMLTGLDTKNHKAPYTNPIRYLGQYLEDEYDSFGYGKIWQKSFEKIGFNCHESDSCDADCSHLLWGENEEVVEVVKEESCGYSVRHFLAGRYGIGPLLTFIAAERDHPEGSKPFFAWYGPWLPHHPMDGKKVVEQLLCHYADIHKIPDNDCTRRDIPDKVLALDLWLYGKDKFQLVPEYKTGAGDEALEKLKTLYAKMCRLRTSDVNQQRCRKIMGVDYSEYEIIPDNLRPDYLRSADFVNYFNNIMLLDYWVGQLLDFLAEAEEGIRGNTYVILMTDNGRKLPKSKNESGENGFRTPILIAHPDLTPHVSLERVTGIDLLPTILDLADMPRHECALECEPALPAEVATPGGLECAPPPTPNAQGCLEGRSLRSVLEVDPTVDPTPTPRELVFNTHRGRPFLHTSDGFRLYRYNCNKYRLFDIYGDPDEKCDLTKDPLPSACDDLPVRECEAFAGGTTAEVCRMQLKLACHRGDDDTCFAAGAACACMDAAVPASCLTPTPYEEVCPESLCP